MTGVKHQKTFTEEHRHPTCYVELNSLTFQEIWLNSLASQNFNLLSNYLRGTTKPNQNEPCESHVKWESGEGKMYTTFPLPKG